LVGTQRAFKGAQNIEKYNNPNTLSSFRRGLFEKNMVYLL